MHQCYAPHAQSEPHALVVRPLLSVPHEFFQGIQAHRSCSVPHCSRSQGANSSALPYLLVRVRSDDKFPNMSSDLGLTLEHRERAETLLDIV